MTVRSRIAPTPSGLLHLGNAVNFLLTWLIVRDRGGVLRLRIDDCDRSRIRHHYVEDIFRQLDWLRIGWDEGPTGPDDFTLRHSQGIRTERYRAALAEISTSGRTYACACSRKQIEAVTSLPVYPGTCRRRDRPAAPPHAVRLHVEEGVRVAVNGREIDLAGEMGDFILWRRDDLPAYQLVSLVDDVDDRVDLIVRGEDLLQSTAAQIHLADCWRRPCFRAVHFLHHPLLVGIDGRKLSKSDNALSLAAMREKGTSPTDVYRRFARLFALPDKEVVTLDDLLAVYRQNPAGILLPDLLRHAPPPSSSCA
ncbi:MAG: glutamate--tRNA ligase family protein [Thermodesulfobacteriota bacterium]